MPSMSTTPGSIVQISQVSVLAVPVSISMTFSIQYLAEDLISAVASAISSLVAVAEADKCTVAA